jgi:ABC-2 type transport system ATP-binding protein
MNDIVVSVNNVSKLFKNEKKPALSDISIQLTAGKIIGLVGPDGAGKTTLMRLIASLLEPTSGSIEVFGHNTQNAALFIQDNIGYLPQKFGLYEDLTVKENLELYADLRSLTAAEKSSSFERMLNFTGLAPFTSRITGRLSGGMKQKLSLACALLGHPKLLLLDEPSVGVDPLSRRELWKMVQELVNSGIAALWSTAYLDEAERCEEVFLLNDGQLLFSGATADLTSRVDNRVYQVPVSLEKRKAALSYWHNRKDVLDVALQGEKIRLVFSEVPAKTEPELIAVRPRFEDAFIDILHGTQKGDSELIHSIKQKTENNIPPIEAIDLTKRFGDFTAANNISFTVNRGEIFGLLGPNGAGKSTTFKMLCGLLQPTSGKALVSGYDLGTAAAKARSQLGYMAQKFSLYGDLSTKQNLDFFSSVYGLENSKREAKIEHMINIFELQPYINYNSIELPLGFKQRLALACAIMHEPDVLFLDEPTSGVDPIARREFWNHINGMVEKGMTIMVTTHFMDEAEYCDRLALIYDGEVIALGTPEELKKTVRSTQVPEPTLEDVFVALIEKKSGESA